MKIGVLVVAFNAESTLGGVISRIPKEYVQPLSVMLISADASQDCTFTGDQSLGKLCPFLSMLLIRHPVNHGYRGNQKAGYRWIVDNNIDVVVLLQGDGQYAPENLPKMVDPIMFGAADVVFGSRMITPGVAPKGGRPIYKFVGNKILTFWENRATQVRLSEWRSGYRAYSRRALSKTAFENMWIASTLTERLFCK
jgi:glycosyltransferase involved in cell wall biosynthesis